MPDNVKELIERWRRMSVTHAQTGNIQSGTILRDCATELEALYRTPASTPAIAPARTVEL